MTMLNVADVTSALLMQIRDHAEINGVFKAVERGEYVNKDPAITPWCGVYRMNIKYEPRQLGHHARTWRGLLHVILIVQAHAPTGEQAEDDLEDSVQRVMTAVLSDLTIGGTVEMLNSCEITYSYDETASETVDYQWAFINLIYETRTGT